MSLSLRDVATAAPLPLSLLGFVPAAALASNAPERTLEFISIPVFGVAVGFALLLWSRSMDHKTAAARTANNE